MPLSFTVYFPLLLLAFVHQLLCVESVVVTRKPTSASECTPETTVCPASWFGSPSYQAWSNPDKAAGTNAGDGADVQLKQDESSNWLILNGFGWQTADFPLGLSSIQGMTLTLSNDAESAEHRLATTLVIPVAGGPVITTLYPTQKRYGDLQIPCALTVKCDMVINNPNQTDQSGPPSLWSFVGGGDIRTVNVLDPIFGVAVSSRLTSTGGTSDRRYKLYDVSMTITALDPTTAAPTAPPTVAPPTAAPTTAGTPAVSTGSTSSGGVPLFAIVGAAVGVVLLAAVIVLVVVIVKRRNSASGFRLDSPYSESPYENMDSHHSMEMSDSTAGRESLLGRNFLL